ncbi:uncharacterized protein PgNI_09612 [Pyricularia grisea]|uniref:Uncharacterized protein n=1 Tax=Pyricularia grisea TaxID=148305 RepID=A0A6P8AT74_PYRGI|nr:uncharacterized protein PgNI_09612 [Pyricularia grisea]TLD05331.1 hypothetical protein PgNI_09612 [Pyricularia grisea]
MTLRHPVKNELHEPVQPLLGRMVQRRGPPRIHDPQRIRAPVHNEQLGHFVVPAVHGVPQRRRPRGTGGVNLVRRAFRGRGHRSQEEVPRDRLVAGPHGEQQRRGSVGAQRPHRRARRHQPLHHGHVVVRRRRVQGRLPVRVGQAQVRGLCEQQVDHGGVAQACCGEEGEGAGLRCRLWSVGWCGGAAFAGGAAVARVADCGAAVGFVAAAVTAHVDIGAVFQQDPYDFSASCFDSPHYLRVPPKNSKVQGRRTARERSLDVGPAAHQLQHHLGPALGVPGIQVGAVGSQGQDGAAADVGVHEAGGVVQGGAAGAVGRVDDGAQLAAQRDKVRTARTTAVSPAALLASRSAPASTRNMAASRHPTEKARWSGVTPTTPVVDVAAAAAVGRRGVGVDGRPEALVTITPPRDRFGSTPERSMAYTVPKSRLSMAACRSRAAMRLVVVLVVVEVVMPWQRVWLRSWRRAWISGLSRMRGRFTTVMEVRRHDVLAFGRDGLCGGFEVFNNDAIES